MKLKEYIETLKILAEENPAALEYELVTSKDDEGNGYNAVYYGPSIGIYEDGEFIPATQAEEWDREASESNSICLN